MGRTPKKKWEEMTELERILEMNERLKTENAYLKKLRKLRLMDEALLYKRQEPICKRFSKNTVETMVTVAFS